MNDVDRIKRAQGCLLGQLTGDSLGSLVEFKTPEEIKHLYPNGVRKLEDGGTWDTIAGQPTDDSELALLLARSIVECNDYNVCATLSRYKFWLDSDPFDCGTTTMRGIKCMPDFMSQSNGALMRISPLGIFGYKFNLKEVSDWARIDALLTHPNKICTDINSLFAMAISYTIKHGISADELYQLLFEWSTDMDLSIQVILHQALKHKPIDYITYQGWVSIAFHNAVWQLMNASSFENAIVDTVMSGGDTDTNAAICGALLGAVYGIDEIPTQWVESALNCKPSIDNPKVQHPRPECLWPCDALELAVKLLG